MASKRDRLKLLNQVNHARSVNEEPATTIVDELVEQYEKQENATTIAVKADFKTEVTPKESELIQVIDKSRVGRPKVLEGVYKPISARLKMENYEHARKVGGRFGGMNAYINYLIEQDIKAH